MSANWRDVAHATLEGSECGKMTFPESVCPPIEAGFDGYAVDFRLATRSYDMADMAGGEALELETEQTPAPVTGHFDATSIKKALREA